MHIKVNGEQREVRDSLLLLQLLEDLQFVPGTFAVAVNRVFVPRVDYGRRKLAELDEVEVLIPLQGG